jgi:Tol biopolymer transport system component
VSANGLSEAPVVSADGRYVVFDTEATNLAPSDTDTSYDVLVWDGADGSFDLASLGSTGPKVLSDAGTPSISADGRYVSFVSPSSELTSGDTNDAYDVFVRDRQLDTLRRVTDTADGAPSNGRSDRGRLSGDGHTLVLHSEASNLVPGDTNGVKDVFVRDLTR